MREEARRWELSTWRCQGDEAGLFGAVRLCWPVGDCTGVAIVKVLDRKYSFVLDALGKRRAIAVRIQRPGEVVIVFTEFAEPCCSCCLFNYFS